jgi:hypothetical protein
MKRVLVATEATDEPYAKRPRLDELAQAFPFLDLIMDMQAEVLRHIRKVGTRSALARTCKALHERVNPRLPERWTAAAAKLVCGVVHRPFAQLLDSDIPRSLWARAYSCEVQAVPIQGGWSQGLDFHWYRPPRPPRLVVWALHWRSDPFEVWKLCHHGRREFRSWRGTLDEIVATPLGQEWLAFLWSSSSPAVIPHSPENGQRLGILPPSSSATIATDAQGAERTISIRGSPT